MEEDDSRERTLFVTNIHEDVTEALLHELMVQAGPVYNVNINRKNRPIAFVEFKHEESIPYSIALLNNVCLFNLPLTLKARDGSRVAQKIAAQRTQHQEREQLRDREQRAATPPVHQHYPIVPSFTTPQPQQQVNLAAFAQRNAYIQQLQLQQQQQIMSPFASTNHSGSPSGVPFNFSARINRHSFPSSPFMPQISPGPSPDSSWGRQTPPVTPLPHSDSAQELRKLHQYDSSASRHGRSYQHGSADYFSPSNRFSSNSYESSRSRSPVVNMTNRHDHHDDRRDRRHREDTRRQSSNFRNPYN